MASQPTSLERAFELARSGQFYSLEDIRLQLNREGLNPRQIEGPVCVDSFGTSSAKPTLRRVAACGGKTSRPS